jgi:hypothetical protein
MRASACRDLRPMTQMNQVAQSTKRKAYLYPKWPSPSPNTISICTRSNTRRGRGKGVPRGRLGMVENSPREETGSLPLINLESLDARQKCW